MNNKTYLIEEEQYLEKLRKIIKRDFFKNSLKKEEEDAQQLPMSLNQFLAQHKSQENQIFSELVKSDYEDFKKKNQWMEKCSKFMLEADKEQPKLYSNMLGKNQQLKAIDHGRTKEDAQNGVFFHLDKQTKSYLNKEHHESKKIIYENCSIDNPNIHNQARYIQKNYRNYELEELPQTPLLEGKSTKKRQNNQNQQSEYSMRREPSPEPEAAPIMTWGQVESTPQRIQEYSIPETPKRDQLLEQMNAKIYKEKKIRKDRKDELKMKILSSVRPNMSSYRKASVQRLQSNKRQPNKMHSTKLDDLLN